MDFQNLLGGISPETFLKEYWQKKPLLVRQAVPFQNPVTSRDELMGLACDEQANSRLVQERHTNGPWQVDYGPFLEEDFEELPKSHWSLLISDCEKLIPELRFLLEPFRFIPDWRIDDLMISYAADQGSVGPHVDDYDVFLLQLDGVRRWQLGGFSDGDEFIEDLPLRILSEFRAEQTFELQPGDLLYLPPRYAHYGVAQGPCLTASIGFRAPSYRDLLQAYMDEIVLRTPDTLRYEDPHLTRQEQPGEISQRAVEQFRAIIDSHIKLSHEQFVDWLGRYLSEGRTEILPPTEVPLYDEARFMAALDSDVVFERNDYSRLAYSEISEGVMFFADRNSYRATSDCVEDIQLLCNQTRFKASDLRTIGLAAMRELLFDLYNSEVIFLSHT
ncbi:MAG: JmjC domain-containing protein [Thiotrichales bacterium]